MAYIGDWYTALKQSGFTSNLKKSKELVYAGRSAEIDRNLAYSQNALKMRYDEDYRQKQLAQNKEQYNQEMALKQEALAKESKASTISGITQIPTTALGLYSGGKTLGLWGGATPLASQSTIAGSGVGGASAAQTGAMLAANSASPLLAGGLTTGAESFSLGGGALSVNAPAMGTGLTTTTSGTGTAAAGLGTVASSVGASAGAGYAAGKIGGQMATWKISQKLTPWKGEKTERRMGGAAAGLGAGALAGSMILPGIGTVVGAVVGAVAGGVSQSVICTELNRQGLLPYKVLEYDSMYGKTLDSEVYSGYRLWADKVVKLMQKSELFTNIVKPFGLAFAYESASRMNPAIKGNKLGKVMLAIGVPLCKLIYKISEMNKSKQLEVQHGIS